MRLFSSLAFRLLQTGPTVLIENEFNEWINGKKWIIVGTLIKMHILIQYSRVAREECSMTTLQHGWAINMDFDKWLATALSNSQ